jgi:hypothetical protein
MHARAERAPRGPAVIAVVTSPDEADQALDAGADVLDPAGPGVSEAIRARRPAAPLWRGRAAAPGSALAPVDCDQGTASLPAVVAVATIAAWRGAPAVRTRQVRPVRRAVDMAAAIRGDRQPACTVRGLA